MAAPNTKAGFWSGVDIRAEDECWPWVGGILDRDGYGHFRWERKRERAHRLAYRFTFGADPGAHEVCHRCDRPACCNPAHLFLGTHQENMADRNRKQRTAHGRRNGRAKLTDEMVLAIRAAHIPYKVSVAKLAARFGVNRYIVKDIVHGVTWRHLLPTPESEAAR